MTDKAIIGKVDWGFYYEHYIGLPQPYYAELAVIKGNYYLVTDDKIIANCIRLQHPEWFID